MYFVTLILNRNLDYRVNTNWLISRRKFKEDLFYPKINAEECYSLEEQMSTISEILESNNLTEVYVQQSKNLFFTRGHLTPSGDGIPADEKKATYYYINVIPQWQTINGGNWATLEARIRSYAEQKSAILTVWTGAWGVTTLKDTNGNDKEIYLGKNYKELLNVLPVPRCFYKVVVDESTRAGIVIIQINSPYKENHKSEDIICTDICNQIRWVNWNLKDARKGYTYCCDVTSFSVAMPGRLPDLGSLSLLI